MKSYIKHKRKINIFAILFLVMSMFMGSNIFVYGNDNSVEEFGVYAAGDGVVTVKHFIKDALGAWEEIPGTEVIIEAIPDTPYTTTDLGVDIPEFHKLSATPANATGVHPPELAPILVEYQYDRIIGSTITTKHFLVDADGVETEDSSVVEDTLLFGEQYTTIPLDPIPAGYKLRETPANSTGEVPNGETQPTTDVDYYYILDDGVEESTVVTKHYLVAEDETETEIADSEVIQAGVPDADYTTASVDPVPAGYKLREIPANATGKFPADGLITEVNYYYVLDDGIAESTVVTKHYLVAEDGTETEIANSEVVQLGAPDIDYITAPVSPVPSGYKLKGTPANATGKFPADGLTTEVNYYYVKEVIIIEEENNNNQNNNSDNLNSIGNVADASVNKKPITEIIKPEEPNVIVNPEPYVEPYIEPVLEPILKPVVEPIIEPTRPIISVEPVKPPTVLEPTVTEEVASVISEPAKVNPQTGDNSNINYTIYLGVISFVAIIFLMLKKQSKVLKNKK